MPLLTLPNPPILLSLLIPRNVQEREERLRREVELRVEMASLAQDRSLIR
jgi:hypothetical protein